MVSMEGEIISTSTHTLVTSELLPRFKKAQGKAVRKCLITGFPYGYFLLDFDIISDAHDVFFDPVSNISMMVI